MTDPDTVTIVGTGSSRRHAAEKRFRAYGIFAIALSLAFLVFIVGTIAIQSSGAFMQTFVKVAVELPAEDIDPDGSRDPATLSNAPYGPILKKALRQRFPDAKKRKEKKELYALVSSTAEYSVRDAVLANPDLIGTTADIWVRASADLDQAVRGNVDREAERRRVSDRQFAWLDDLQEAGEVERRFNTAFFTRGDSREPEQAGILGAMMGSFLTLIVCFLLSFPLGVLAAVYLEEFAAKGRISRLIEVNINNLAAVPSIVFGLLGLAIFLNVFDLPRSTPLVGGMVLALMTLPTIIIASRASLRAVPPSVREAAFGLGANRVQTTFHHTVPLAMPGMLTGAIIGMARALGETAPLLMIGMVAFIVDVPGSFTDAATALPVQVFLWADAPDRGFEEKTSAAIIVLLVFLVLMNLAAIVLRRRLERRW